MSDVVLLLVNTDRLQQVEDYVRGCITSTKYWLPSTSCRSCQRLYYFYQILTAFNKLKIMSEVVLLPVNTDCFQQVENYVRCCTTSTKTLAAFNKLRLYVRGCSTSTKYWPLSISLRLCQRLFYFYQRLTDFNKFKIMSEIVLLLPILTAFNKLTFMSEVVLLLINTGHIQQFEDYVSDCTTSTKHWPP